ncbi:tRNA (adenosine(37)-N6)-threonylcarbamoyltransferase complex ATPase subunit type 1 TsaE [Cognatishimia sp. SS12]|uniref:tRNA (adenosine(37)-N6)-threonylcarbamoyltransferase complex ATPase subunit type 1 TsaE n=1 Tax=Cognatishimia sp. SS12 TaxID=2979465 RepID=UPI00232DAEFF|nr:tRNA (adenosine(37)-N6)-threonylcarbamoyltransferase complex ATPase subunit type 1 TsaE [Cognatishimia sp. SS12]MDC0737761.1 tRNA (adenosine(37)-N6)-threonylcarbamoyltransferase complex ATPase subunit type 1 TsaE [Cognatishimia sp. SS12]
MTQRSLQATLTSPEKTAAWAAALGARLDAGDVILLTGDIGAGKTHFSRSLIQHRLGYAEDVPSPTFTLVQTYEAGDIEIWHADLYRLTTPDEVVELGLTEAFETAICLVEWPDRLAELAPENALMITLKMCDTPGERALSLQWRDPKWHEILKDLPLE